MNDLIGGKSLTKPVLRIIKYNLGKFRVAKLVYVYVASAVLFLFNFSKKSS